VNTIKDVAERAGVSIATVSRVYNDSSSVNSKTRDRVLQAARELAYSPNILARGLMRKKTETIGVVLPDLSGEFFSEVIRGIDEVAARRGFHILLSSSHSRLDDMERLLRLMAQGRVDGMLLMAPQLRKDLLPLLSTTKLPLVLLESSVNGLDVDSYYIDNFRGAFLVVQHLIEHGHRRIAAILGPEDNFDARERHRGYEAALAEKAIPITGELAFKGDFQKRSGYFSMKRILSTAFQKYL
jgi:LacI family transcriptional regulator